MNTKALPLAAMALVAALSGSEIQKNSPETASLDLSEGSPACRTYHQIGFGADKPIRVFTGVGKASRGRGARTLRCMYGERILADITTGDLFRS